MTYKKDFDKNSKLSVWRYEIREDDDHVLIRFQQIPGTKKHLDYPDEKMRISQMHIANIPAVVAAINAVLQMKEGGSVEIKESGDKLDINMLFDDHGQFKDLTVRDKSGQIKVGLSHTFEFVFEDLILINNPPLPRTPTPAMIWVTDTLVKIHDDWERR